VPKIHDLVGLLEETKDLVPSLIGLSADINQLSGLFVISRYPTVEEPIGDLAEEVDPAVTTMTEVRRIVRVYLGLSAESEV
jgi:HEPN domain-containing protein